MRFVSSPRSIIFRNTIYGLIEMVVSAILMLVSIPYLLTGLGVNNYGLWNLALAFLGLMGIADIGMGSATTKFIAEFDESRDIKRLSEIITISFLTAVLLGTIFTAFLYVQAYWLASFFFSSATHNDDIVTIFKICALGLFPVMLENIGLAIPRGFQDYRTATTFLFAKNASIIALAVWMVSRGGTVIQVIMGTIIIEWVVASSTLLVAFLRVRKKGAHITFSFKTFAEFIEFTLYMGMTGIGIKIFTFFDRVVVAQTLGLDASAYYSIATGVANKFTAFGSAITQALFPAFSSWSVSKSRRSILEKLMTITSLVGMSAIIPGTILLIFLRPLVFWWLGEENGSAALVPIQILVFIYMVKVITTPSYQAANGLGYPRLTTLVTLISGLGTIGLIFVLGKHSGLAGAAWANIAVWAHFLLPVFMYSNLTMENNSPRPVDTRRIS